MNASAIDKGTRLANEPEASEDEEKEGHCPNCGYDLRSWTDGGWNRGIRGCKDCPSCHAFPHWLSGEIEDLSKRVAVPCKTCGESFVTRASISRDTLYIRTADYKNVLKTKYATREHVSSYCGACDSYVSYKNHMAAADRALAAATEKRASQKRGLKAFLIAEAKKSAAETKRRGKA